MRAARPEWLAFPCARSEMGKDQGHPAKPAPLWRRIFAHPGNGEHDMADQEQAEIRLRLARLRQEHEDYDAAINAMIQTGCDALRIQRMKKKKLAIKDSMSQIEDQIIPDIIA